MRKCCEITNKGVDIYMEPGFGGEIPKEEHWCEVNPAVPHPRVLRGECSSTLLFGSGGGRGEGVPHGTPPAAAGSSLLHAG